MLIELINNLDRLSIQCELIFIFVFDIQFQAAQKFYSLLVLKKFQALEIRQDMAYGDIEVTKGIMFDNPKL